MQDKKELYQSELPRRSSRERVCSRPGIPPAVITTIVDTNELDSITAATGVNTGEFVSAVSTPEEPNISIQKTRPTRRTKLK